MSDEFIATYRGCVQVSPEDFRMVPTSKVFIKESNFIDVFTWLESMGIKNPKITDVEFSDLD